MVPGWQQLGWFAAADPVSLCDLWMGVKRYLMVAGDKTQHRMDNEEGGQYGEG
jgi:hypothetical protein